ncbi:MAG: bifunctional UDP-N-acetylglucosamine diphosphorylase/glucosamine-1-phosphate N-acetyltransferase GlmU, partial [Gammaproteobacteria bacterium]
MSLTVVILAAGKGTRMRSNMPKVAHELAGKPLVAHVIQTSKELRPKDIRLVYGHGGDQLKTLLNDQEVSWHLQAEQLGTGHAVDMAMPGIDSEDVVLVLYGDVPLIQAETLKGLVAAAQGDALGLLTVELDDPTGYGRIVRDHHNGAVLKIVEQKDATAEEASIKEVNTGILAVKAGPLNRWLSNLDNKNAQGEYYLTDIIELAVADQIAIATSHPAHEQEVAGVNNKSQLSVLERHFQRSQADLLMSAGVMILDPLRFDIRGSLKHGMDVTLDVNVIIEGTVELGNNVRIGANCILKNCSIGDDVTVEPNSVLESASIGSGSTIGPFARLRPGAELKEKVRVGNFVEIKKSIISEGAKVNHLTYIGDAEIGERTNIGAGTITCNYDGANKHRTVIGKDVFV